MDKTMLKDETVMNYKLKAFYGEPGSILCSDNSIDDMCDINMHESKRPIIDADFMNKIEEAYDIKPQNAVFDFNVTPRRIPCSDMPIEDVCIFKNSHNPKRLKISPELMKEIDNAHPITSPKPDYENQIIDMKRKVLVSEPSNCTFDSPCGQESCLRFKTIEYNSNLKHDLRNQLLGDEKKEMKPFTYSFNLEMYSGIENIQKEQEKVFANGGFGQVYKCSDSKTKCLLIMKQVSKEQIEPNEVEIPILLQNEENIARVLGCFFDGQYFNIIQEYAGTSLNNLIKDKSEFLKKHILIFSSQLFTGVNTLAQHSITHWDLKPQNICLNIKDGSFLLKLIDFGSCQTNKDPKRLTGLTPEYLPPDFNKAYFEARKQHTQNKDSTLNLQRMRSFNTEVDIWAAGLTILFIYKRAHPTMQYFQKDLSMYTDRKEKKAETIRLIGQLSDPLSQYFTTGNESIDHLLSNVLLVNANSRWKASKILEYLEGELKKPHPERCQTIPELHMPEKNVDNMDVDIKKENLVLRKRTVLHDKKLKASLNEMKLQMSVSSAIRETEQHEDLMDYNLQVEHFNSSANQGQPSGIEKAQLCLIETIRTESKPLENVFVNQELPSLSLAEDRIPRFDILLRKNWANFLCEGPH